jgi:hypothetical protein
MFFEHRTLNLMLLTFWFFFMHAAARLLAQSLSPLYFPPRRNRISKFQCHLIPPFLLLLQPRSPICRSGRRTLSILAPADLDELLDVGNFGRHLGGYVSRRVGGIIGGS